MTPFDSEASNVIDARSQFGTGPSIGSPTLPQAALHGLAGEYVRLIAPETEADPAALLIQFFSFFGSSIGRSAFVVLDVSRHYGNLFVVVVGATSKGRKGTSLAHIEAIFSRVCPDWSKRNLVSGLSTGEGLVQHLKDKDTDLSGVDDEGEPVRPDKRCLVIEAEFGRTLAVAQREGSTLSPIMRDCWDGRDISIMTKGDPLKASNCHISIIGHVTVSELKKLMRGVDRANGFGNRFLWTHSERRHTLPLGGNIDQIDFTQLDARLAKCVALGIGKERRLNRTEGANQKWVDVYDGLSEGSEGPVGDLTSRAEAQVMRLALLYALLDERNEIDVEHLDAALALWGYCYQTVSLIFGDPLSQPLAATIYSALQHAPIGLKLTELSGKLGNNKRSEDIQDALNELESAGLASFERQNPTGGKGRPAVVWRAVAKDCPAYAA